MPPLEEVVALFRTKAELVSATVSEVENPMQALEYTVALCDRKQACQLLVAGCDAPLSPKAEDLCDHKQQKVIAAPGLVNGLAEDLQELCDHKGIRLVTGGLREHLAGVDIGLTFVDYGIAETGTLVLDSSNEDLRLATMISEIHIGVLSKSRLRHSAFDLEDELQNSLRTTPNYTAFITGASRTADIERVLALGVHGPLELHILLMEN
ncbi:MAG: lactate utilization protein B/C [Deltaproteobacteria bacterium SG8_13]|nr:MAG: lactate utilization protein B/C [Deltaproteobacteria bacterium SG8_13]